jgi:hypothetical protein
MRGGGGGGGSALSRLSQERTDQVLGWWACCLFWALTEENMEIFFSFTKEN